MKTYQINLINGLTLIIMPLWALLTYEGTVEKPCQSPTALIPLFLGVILLSCNAHIALKNKVITHASVIITLIALLGLYMPLKAAIVEDRTMSILRVGIMLFTGVYAMISFVRSFIEVRKAKK